MKKIIILIMMLATALLGRADEAGTEPEWILVTDRDGVKVYRQDEQDTRLKTFRGVARMQVDDFKAIGVLMDDYDSVADFMHMVSEIRDVKRYAHDKRDVYVTTQLPWPVSDRDAPLRVSFYQEPDSYDLVMPISLNPGMPEQKGYEAAGIVTTGPGYLRHCHDHPIIRRNRCQSALDPAGAHRAADRADYLGAYGAGFSAETLASEASASFSQLSGTL